MTKQTGGRRALTDSGVRARCCIATVILLSAVSVRDALAWGHTGHVKISQLAILELPEEIPMFLRSAEAARRIGELGAEADESKTTGIVLSGLDAGRIQTASTVHDAERDPGHFIDIGDNGVVLGGSVSLSALPPTREAFDSAQRTATSPDRRPSTPSDTCPTRLSTAFSKCGRISASGGR